MVALAMLTLRRAGASTRDASFGALVTTFLHTGFMRVPLLTASRGQAATGPLVRALMVDLVLASSACMALASHDDRAGHGSLAAIAAVVASASSNPLPWAIAGARHCRPHRSHCRVRSTR